MTEYKTEMSITKIENTKKKQNWTTLLWRSTKQTSALMKLTNTKKRNKIFTTEHKTEYNFTLVN